MKILRYAVLLSLLTAFSVVALAGTRGEQHAAVGFWKTYNDKTKRPSSVIQIYESNGKYYGKVVKSFPNSGEKQLTRCSACKGNRHNKPIIGLNIIRDLSYRDGKYSGGKILDPRDGKEYKCRLTVGKAGKKLYVKGYIGVPLLGRTVVWFRTNEPN